MIAKMNAPRCRRAAGSDLFGRRRGAFTGASAQRIGRFELADKARCFWMKWATLPLGYGLAAARGQLREQSFERLGGNKLIRPTCG